MVIMTMSSKLSLNLLRGRLVLCFALPCAPQAVSQSALAGAPEPPPLTFQGFFGNQITEVEKRQEDRIRALLEEVRGIKVAEFVVDDLPLQEALARLWKLVPQKTRYLKEFRIVPGDNYLPVAMSQKNAELGAILLSLGPASGSRIEEKEGVVTYHRGFFPGDRHEIPLKSRTAELLRLPKEAPDSKALVDVTDILSKWKIEKLRTALYVPKTCTLYVQGFEDETALLRSVIFLLEQGAAITFPE